MPATADAALTELDTARDAFEEALRGAPDASLRFRPPGEDYALGGLVIHVAEVLEKYTRVLEDIHDAGAGSVHEAAAPISEADEALIRDGFGAEGRTSALQRVRQAHADLSRAVRALPTDAFEHKTPIIYAGSSEPYPTSAADVVGWVRGHYDEHVSQIGELVEAWSQTTR